MEGTMSAIKFQGESTIVELSSGPTMFSTTSVKPYYDRVIGGGKHADASNDNDNAPDPPDSTDSSGPSPSPRDLSPPPDPPIEHRPEHVPTTDATTPPIERGLGRPKNTLCTSI